MGRGQPGVRRRHAHTKRRYNWLVKYRLETGYVPTEQTEATVGVTGCKTDPSPYFTVRSYDATSRTTVAVNSRIHASMPCSLAVPGPGDPVCSIATLLICNYIACN